MDAVIRFRKWLRTAPVAVVIVGTAGGCCCLNDCKPSSLSASDKVVTRTSGTVPTEAVARPQAPDAPAQPAAPVVPLSVGPSQAKPAPVVPAVTAEPGVVPAPVVPADSPGVPAPSAVTNLVPGNNVTPVSSTEMSFDQASTQVRVVAVIGTDIVITDDEIWQMVRQQAGEYIRLTGNERAAKEKELFRKSLRVVIERELAIADFLGKLKKNKPQLIDEVMDQASQTATKQLRDFKKMNKTPNDEELAKMMRSQGLSLKALQRQMERNAIMNMYVGSANKDIKSKIGLAEIETYYKTHPDDFKIEDRARWLDLFISYSRFASPAEAKKQAESLLVRAKAGESFSDLILQYGHGDSRLRNGIGAGELRGEIKPAELEPVVFGLAEGAISDLIPTEFGIHIVKVVEREKAGTAPFDEKAQSFIKMKLVQKAQEQDRAKLIEDLWRKTTVKIVELP